MKLTSKDWYYFKSILLLFFICLLVYGNSLKSPFQFDGVQFIKTNPYIKSFSIFFDQFKVYRLLQRSILVFTYTANYELGKDDTFGFHLINLFIHFCVCLLIYLIARKMLEHRIQNQEGGNCKYVPLLAALLFAAHPLHTESVTYLMSRSAALATFFYLAGFYGFMILLDIKHLEIPSLLKNIRMMCQGSFVLILVILGLGTKLIIVSLPVVMIFYFILFFSPEGESRKTIIQREYKILLPIATLLGIFLIYKAFITKHGLFDTSGTWRMQYTRWDYLLSQIKWLNFYYLKLFFFPLSLNVDPDVSAIKSLSDPKLILSVIVITLFLFNARKLTNWVIFGWAWLILTIAPESSFVPLQDVVADHRMYLPSIGLFLISPFLFNRPYFIVLYCCLVLIYGANLVHRNNDWRSETSLWKDTVAKSPQKARPYINLARSYQLSEDFEEAIVNYKKAAARDTGYFIIHHNLATLYERTGRCDLALEEYRLALILKPKLGESMIGLAECYSQTEKYDLAIKHLEEILKNGTHLALAYRLLGKIHYFYLKQKERGKNYFRKALELDPDNKQNTIIKNIIGN